MSVAPVLHHGEVLMNITFFDGFDDAVKLHRTCRAADTKGNEVMQQVSRWTVLEAAYQGAYARRWVTWGPHHFGGTRTPVGLIPFIRRWPCPPVLRWSFGEWHARARAVGLRVVPLQSPLYYYKAAGKISERNMNRSYCTMRGCGKSAVFFGAVMKGEDHRRDVCGDCGNKLVKRGRMHGDSLARMLPAA